MNRNRQSQQQDQAGIQLNQSDRARSEILQRARNAEHRILRLPQVKLKIARANATIWKDVAAGTLSKPISIGTRSVGWLESEINAWIEARIFNSRSPAQAINMRELVTLLANPNNETNAAKQALSIPNKLTAPVGSE